MSKFTPLGVLGLLPFAAAAALPSGVLAQDAPQGAPFFTNCMYGFSIIFPERPEQKDIFYAANNGKLQPAHQFFVAKGPNRYSVTIVAKCWTSFSISSSARKSGGPSGA